MSIATVVSITGQAWARDAEGNLRELQQGDQLLDGETLVTSDNGAVELDFADGLPPVAIGGGQQVAMSDELNADALIEPDDASAQDEGIEALLASLEGEGDLLDDLEATAAGGGGGAEGGGHSFIQLARISESVDPLAFSFENASNTNVVNDGESSLEFSADEATTPLDTTPLDNTAEVTVSLADVYSSNVANTLISGTTTDVEAGQIVNLVISDDDATTADVTASASVEADGSYATTADLSSLNDGGLSVTATVEDQAGNQASATDTATLDTGYGDEGDSSTNATVDITDQDGEETINGEGDTATITGSIGANGASLDSLVISDGDDSTDDLVLNVDDITVDATTGNYEVTGVDVSGLADGTLTVTANSTDTDGNTAAPTDTVTLDTGYGDEG
ncbi:retention module-containing protein, partial [Onishia niordana]|uniref:retention module-containing protein n=1 Tax=Onishia niordana TaxID=2508711 RepID=UPI0010A0B082